DIPGEESWPTQPFPLKPAPYARQLLTEDDLANYSPESHDSLLQVFRSLRYEGLFTPPSLQGTLQFPGSRGGSSWGGGAYDATTGLFYVKSNDSPELMRMKLVERESAISNQSVYRQGEVLYNTYCVSCHGSDRNGDELTATPSLIGLKSRMSEADILNRIKHGAGKMPGFSSVINDRAKEQAILAYLFEQENKQRPSRESRMLDEISSNQQASAEKVAENTFDQYLNLTAYGHFRDH